MQIRVELFWCETDKLKVQVDQYQQLHWLDTSAVQHHMIGLQIKAKGTCGETERSTWHLPIDVNLASAAMISLKYWQWIQLNEVQWNALAKWQSARALGVWTWIEWKWPWNRRMYPLRELLEEAAVTTRSTPICSFLPNKPTKRKKRTKSNSKTYSNTQQEKNFCDWLHKSWFTNTFLRLSWCSPDLQLSPLCRLV